MTPAVIPALRPGDRVAVVASSSPIRPEMLAAGLDELRRLGLEPVVRDDVSARHRFAAGTDERRLSELRDAYADPSIRALVAARGGYGLTPLLRALPPELVAANPKPVLGESDVTALGCWSLVQGVGWLHGPMAASSLRQGASGYVEASLRAALFESGARLEAADGRVLREGEAEGVLWGGCLSLLASLCGTPWLPRVEPALLVIEDVGVKPYQVHRMLVQLRDAGALRGVAGVVLGDFSDCVQHAEQGYDVADVIAELFDDASGPVPVTIGWPIGHAPAPHLTLPMGARARLTARAGAPPALAWWR